MKLQAILISLLLVGGCATQTPTPVVTPPTTIPTPTPVVVVPPPPVVRPYDGHVKYLASWLPNSGPDGSFTFTNAQMLTMDCDTPAETNITLRARADSDGRAIILHSGLMGWGNDGYQVVDPQTLATCWSIEKRFIQDYAPRVIEVHTADEPPDVAWSHQTNGVYNPNRYNNDLSLIASTIHGDFPLMPVSVDYGSLPDGLVIPSGINHVWLETYDVDWKTKLTKLSSLTTLPLALMPPGFVAGDPEVLDSQKAQIIWDEWTEAKANPRITSLIFFLWCCDDTTTGDKNFYTVSGGRIPLTLAALKNIGQAILSQ